MEDDYRIGVEWMEFDPDTGELKLGIAFEDGGGFHATVRRHATLVELPVQPIIMSKRSDPTNWDVMPADDKDWGIQ